MHQIRNRITYANVMSTIAVFLVLGGATAVAASKLGKNTVGTKQLKANSVTTAKLKKNAVTEKKVRNGAITTSKIKDGAVTGAKVQTATLGTVPSAATFNGYNRRGIVRVAESPAGEAAAPEVPLFSAGAFSVYAKCFTEGGGTVAVLYIRTSENGSIFESEQTTFGGNPDFLNTTTPEQNREVLSEFANVNEADYFGVHTTEFAAMAPGGTVVRGDTQIGVKNGNPPGGNGIYGNGNVCLFAGEMTALNG